MVSVEVFKNNDEYAGFICSGHAGFAKAGQDIVCAAVSTLVINTINAIIEFTDDEITAEQDEKNAVIKCTVANCSKETKLLLDTMVLGLDSVLHDNNDEYIEILFKEGTVC